MSKQIELAVASDIDANGEDDREPLEEMKPIKLRILNSNLNNSTDGLADGEGRSSPAANRSSSLSEVLKQSLKRRYEKERDLQSAKTQTELVVSDGSPVKDKEISLPYRERAPNDDIQEP